MFKNHKCVVTGGCGFIGSNLVHALAGDGSLVTVIDNLSTGRREHLPDSEAVSLIEADVATFNRWDSLLADADYIFHLAAQVGNMKSIEHTESDARTNIMGSVRLYSGCRGRRLKKLVYASSSAIFGEAQYIPIDEQHPQKPASFYAVSKQTAEQYALLAHDLWGVPSVCVRFFNVYGAPMENGEYSGVICIFKERMRRREPLTIYGGGVQIRDFVYVKDVCQALMLAAVSGEPGSTYNIGSGQHHSIRDLAREFCAVAGRETEIRQAPFRPGEVRRSAAEIRKARVDLGYAPQYSLSAGLREIWDAD